MKWSHFKSKLLVKYTLSYIAIFLIPLVILTFFIYQNAVDTLRSEIEQSNANQLNQAKIIIDNGIKELQEVASRISYDDQLTSYLVHHPYYSREAIDALNQYKAVNSLADEIFLFFRGDDRIYSSRGKEHLDVFTEHYRFQTWKKKDLIWDLNTAMYPQIRPAEQVDQGVRSYESMLAYLVPITPSSTNPHGTVMFLMNESNLTNLIESILSDYQGSTFIYNEEGQVLAASYRGEKITPQDTAALSKLEPGTHHVTVNREPHSVVSVRSESGWTYVAAMPSSQFSNRIVHIQSFFLLIFSMVVVIGTVLAVILARRQYHPISDLLEFVRSNASEESSPPGNELEWIKNTLREFSQQIDLQEPYARDHALLVMLKHGQTDELTREFKEKLGIRFYQSHYFVVCMGWNRRNAEDPDRPDREPVLQVVSEVNFPSYSAHAYGLELPQPNQLAMIIGFDLVPSRGGTVQEHTQSIVAALRDLIMEETHLIPAIGVGRVYEGSEQLNQSYIEASTAYEASILHGEGGTTFFEALSETPDASFWVPKDVLLKLVQSLKQGSYDVAAQMVTTALCNLKQEKPSVPLMRCICFDILNTMLKTASELGIHHVISQIPKLTSFDTLEELEKKLLGLAAEICEQVQEKSDTEESSLMEQIIAYIEDNYTDYDLSLGSISSKYSISTSYFSRYFKEKVGINFSQYIWQKRMDEVIRLLLHTSDPLKDIITRVGYLDTPNFIRKFKKETGLTPGQYRKIHSPDAPPPDEEDDEETGT
ncbi:helix-turn-helix domain-containing protein [Paenibacillus sp. F411]|uniref:helix-turn-helix domain-containing protein n=1 Tax=Paenibacillus sp. F411 TaxID=2820239 RepID=UPI001AAE9EC5|nr:helix-turn-helix domain-containing protein [Paenibacillus sp. F411]MBO2944664.1 helix-turn-helix domain-containing protein [Paenibacillus sp. F411]